MSSGKSNSFCETSLNGSQEACIAVAGAIATLQAAADYASGQIAEGLSRTPDFFGLGYAQARMGASFMSSIMDQSGNLAAERSADQAVPPETRCPTCPIRLACQPPEVPDALPPEA